MPSGFNKGGILAWSWMECITSASTCATSTAPRRSTPKCWGSKVTERYAENIRHLMLASPGEPEGTAKVHLFEAKDLDMQDALATLSGQGYAHIAFGTTRERFPAIVEELTKRKVDFKGPLVMGKGESVHFTDPDGNPLEIRCPAPA